MKHRIVPVLAVLAAALLVTANCNKGDQVAPEGATIDMMANPTTIILTNGTGTSDIIATVSSQVGVPLPDQDVRFSTNAGRLYDMDGQQVVGEPIRTNSYGNAQVKLSTELPTTVTGKSGKATGSISLTVSQITLEQDTTSAGCSTTPQEITTCQDRICLVAHALDKNQAGIPGLQITFALQAGTGTNTFDGKFASPPLTCGDPITCGNDPVGSSRTVLTPSTDCSTRCGAFKCATTQVVASFGTIKSDPIDFTISIPQ